MLSLLQAGLLPVQADLGIALAVRDTGHRQIHTDLGALALEVGAQTVDDLLLNLLGHIRAEGLAHAHNVLGSPRLLFLLLDELIAGDVAHGTLGRGIGTLVNVTADRADPLLHNCILL